MIWGEGDLEEDRLLTISRTGKNSSYVLGFNEPNYISQVTQRVVSEPAADDSFSTCTWVNWERNLSEDRITVPSVASPVSSDAVQASLTVQEAAQLGLKCDPWRKIMTWTLCPLL